MSGLNKMNVVLKFLSNQSKSVILNTQLYVVLFCLLLQSGDIEQNPGPSNLENCLSICHCNIRSIRNKLDFIKDNFLDFDILCFTETHLNSMVSSQSLHLSNKFSEPYRKDRTNHGGGLLVYVSNKLIHSRVQNLELFCNESIWIKIKIQNSDYLIGLFYSPRPSDKIFFQNFDRNIEKALETTSNIILLGDLNENIFNNPNNLLKQVIWTNNLKETVKKPTRKNALLDPILIPTNMEIHDSGTFDIPPNISDHKATYIHLPFQHSSNSSYQRTVWLYDKANYELLDYKISNHDWNCLLEGSVDEACDVFTATLIDFAKQCIPSKSITVRDDDQPWYDSAIRKFSRIRDRLKSKATKSKNVHDWSKYKKIRNKVNNLKHHAKEVFFSNLDSNLTDLHQNDKRSFWKIIRHFIKNNSCSSVIPPLCVTTTNGDITYLVTTQDKADQLNEYFTSISTVDDKNVELPPFVSKTDKSILNVRIELSEIVDILTILNVNKASGPDLVSHKMLKAVSKSISKPLHILFNRSLTECVFPKSWKIANFTPIFKKGDNSSVSNYRPVSLLSCCGKIMESLKNCF